MNFLAISSSILGHPVMKTFPQGVSVSPTVTCNEAIEPLSREGEDKISELQEDTSRTEKRLLPDRSHAAHDRANEKLVNFIVKQRMAEERLLVGYTHEQSSWIGSYKLTAHNDSINDDVSTVGCDPWAPAVQLVPALSEGKRKTGREHIPGRSKAAGQGLLLPKWALHHSCRHHLQP